MAWQVLLEEEEERHAECHVGLCITLFFVKFRCRSLSCSWGLEYFSGMALALALGPEDVYSWLMGDGCCVMMMD
jgi:hypothetical protein